MTGAAQAIGAIVSPDLEPTPRGGALLIAGTVVDAVAAGMLLLGTPLPASLEGLVVALFHGTAVLLVCGLPRARPSRRWLCVTAVMAVPFIGAAVAAALSFTRGHGSIASGHRRRARRQPTLTIAALQRLEGALSPCDALDGGDEEGRRNALSALSRRGDSEAIALLRRAAAGRDPDLALSAALVLDEIGERSERQFDRLAPAEARNGTR